MILTEQSFIPCAASVQMLLTLAILTFSHFSISFNFTCTLCNCSLFLAQPRVLHCILEFLRLIFSVGKQIGRTKSFKVTGCSSFIKAMVLPSTGDFSIPTMRLSCSQGVELQKLYWKIKLWMIKNNESSPEKSGNSKSGNPFCFGLPLKAGRRCGYPFWSY